MFESPSLVTSKATAFPPFKLKLPEVANVGGAAMDVPVPGKEAVTVICAKAVTIDASIHAMETTKASLDSRSNNVSRMQSQWESAKRLSFGDFLSASGTALSKPVPVTLLVK